MCRRTGVPAILVIYGNHFNYLRDREVPNDMKEIGLSKNLIQLVGSYSLFLPNEFENTNFDF